MPLTDLTQKTVDKISDAVGADLSAEDIAAIAKIVEKAQIETVTTTSKTCRAVAVSELGADADKAHKLAEAIKEAETALVANLGGLR